MKRIAAISPGALPTRGSPFKTSGFFPMATLDNSPFRSHILSTRDFRDNPNLVNYPVNAVYAFRKCRLYLGARATEQASSRHIESIGKHASAAWHEIDYNVQPQERGKPFTRID